LGRGWRGREDPERCCQENSNIHGDHFLDSTESFWIWTQGSLRIFRPGRFASRPRLSF
jgi:hypothetical protein